MERQKWNIISVPSYEEIQAEIASEITYIDSLMRMHQERNEFIQQKGGITCNTKITNWKIYGPVENPWQKIWEEKSRHL